ncbi:MAG: hypothetical protein DRQ78_08815 [Epsilonproteobacteria bacterium]|nr:MAG: hypothetical protein DRQ78_08815 [Campylobacterota bacterium]
MHSKKLFIGVELSSSKKVNFLVLMSVIGLLGLIVASPYFYDKKYAIYTPMYIDSSEKYGVIFNIDHSLCLTDTDGILIDNRSYKDLGIKDVADAKFFNDSIILVQGDGKIKQCSTSLNSCTQIGSVSSYRADIFMRIIPSKDEKSFYVIQTNKHKIDKFDKEGKYLYKLDLAKKDLKYPSGGVALTDDTILFADTSHKRVIAVQDKGEDNSSVIWSLSSYSDMKRHSYGRVLDVKLDTSSNVWMNNTNKSYEDADTIVMDITSIKDYKSDINKSTHIEIEDGHTRRIESKLIKYPTSLASHKEGMLISDSEAFKILYIDDSYMPTVFGDSYVQSKLKKISEKREYYQNIINGLFWLFGIGMFLAIVAAIMETPRAMKAAEEKAKEMNYAENQSISESKKIMPDANGVIWLLPSEKLIKQLKWLKPLVGIIILYMIYQLIILFNSLQTAEESTNIFFGFIVLASTPLLFYILFYFLDFSKYSIGINETHLFIQTGFNRKAVATFENVTYFTRQSLFEDNPPLVRIAIGNISIPLMHNNERMNDNSLFDQEQFNYYIKPKLKFSEKISWDKMLYIQFKGINLKLWMMLSSIVIMVAILYVGFSISK